MIRVRIDRRGVVRTVALVRTPLKPISVWGEMRGLTIFAAADPFHREIRVEGGGPRRGAAIEIVHRYAGITVRRVGRILRWNEGVGFVFSDVSRRGVRHGFPHVFMFEVRSADGGGSIVRLDVCGRWTARWMPRAMVWLWQWWVMLQIRNAVRAHLSWLAAAKRKALQRAARAQERA